jgi:ABC-type multidrug transport system ATPase subunit
MRGASAAGKVLVLNLAARSSGEARNLNFELDRGHLYRVVAARAQTRAELLWRLSDTGLAAIVPADGGQIGNLKVWENMVLPNAWRGEVNYRDLEERARAVLADLDCTGERFAALCDSSPDALSRLELKIVAFVRAMLSEPEIVAYDCLFDGLTRSEIELALRFDRLFHRHFPFRTSIHVDLEFASLPDVHAREVFVLQ